MSNSAFLHRQAQGEPGLLSPSHSPVHLRATAHLYGLRTAPLDKANVLMVGCGAAQGLLPFALANPRSRVVGLEKNTALLEQGMQRISELKLENVSLLASDYSAVDDQSEGRFDYIVVSGLYGYLAREQIDTLLEQCAAKLTDDGILYLDHHVQPGAKARDVVRDAIMLHLRDVQTDAEAKTAIQAALTLFDDGLAATNPMATPLRAAAHLAGQQLSALGETLNPNPLAGSAGYFIEVAGQATQAGLAYAGDSLPLSTVPLSFGQGVSLTNSLLTMGQAEVMRQQYLDFATGRGFRQSLWVLSRRAGEINARPDMSRLKDLRWACGLQRLAGGDPQQGITYVNHLGHGITTNDRSVQLVVDMLAHSWPASSPYSTLLANLKLHLRADDLTGRKLTDAALQTLMDNGVVHYSLDPTPYDNIDGAFIRLLPSATPIGQTDVTVEPGFNLWHEAVHVQFSPMQRELADALHSGCSLAQLSSLESVLAVAAASPILNPGTSETAELLHVLRRYGMLLVSSSAWAGLLREGLIAARGLAPYCGLYVSALARLNMESETRRSTNSGLPPLPQLVPQANRMQELILQQDYQQAEASARRLLRAAPRYVDAWEVLTASLFNMNQVQEALESALQMLIIAPTDMRSYVLSAICLARQERTPEAIQAARRAVELEPDSAHAHSALGDALNTERRYKEARAAYEAALQWDGRHRKSLLNLCKVLIDGGDIVAAEKAARAAVLAYPDASTGYSNLLFATNYSPNKSADEVYDAYRECNQHLFLPLQAKWRRHNNERSLQRKLKVGYVSPDFKRHSGNGFIEPLLSRHDRSAFELTAYAELGVPDDVTDKLRTYFDHWVPTSRMTDADLAERIRQDGIDILIDLAGHTQGNRLSTFARKPAPVSLTWMGYGYTTGLSAIDYIATDVHMAPPGSEHLFSENPWRLRSNFVYRAGNAMGEVGELPALRHDRITFGTLTRAIRINDRTLDVWSAVLRRIPTAKLVVNSLSYRDAAMQRELATRFAQRGISQDRLAIGFTSPPWDLLRDIDIGFDCFPHNSGATLIESLYMGVPFVTLADRPSVGRIGSSILHAAGHPEWIAQTEEDYIEKAVALASDIDSLSDVRRNLRADMQHSALMDESGFVDDFERSLKEMFSAWSTNQK